MNILVVASALLSNIVGSTDNRMILTINETYLIGQFDAILLLVDEIAPFEEKFSFAKVYKWHIPKFIDWDRIADAILMSLERMAASMDKDCLFTIMYEDETSVEYIAKKARPKNSICFMAASDYQTSSTFIALPLNLQDGQCGDNYFASSLATYVTEQSPGMWSWSIPQALVIEKCEKSLENFPLLP
ncbi:MAG: hypothetical protein LBB16_00080 [Puniceicoccales bacterium]|jgi:hypothetical protein|nr:hypothetical protein [Puniceicoccales bacterium]